MFKALANTTIVEIGFLYAEEGRVILLTYAVFTRFFYALLFELPFTLKEKNCIVESFIIIIISNESNQFLIQKKCINCCI